MICAKQKKKKIIDFLNNKYKTYVACQCVINVRRRSINRGESEQIGQPRLTCYLVCNSKNVFFCRSSFARKTRRMFKDIKIVFLKFKTNAPIVDNRKNPRDTSRRWFRRWLLIISFNFYLYLYTKDIFTLIDRSWTSVIFQTLNLSAVTDLCSCRVQVRRNRLIPLNNPYRTDKFEKSKLVSVKYFCRFSFSSIRSFTMKSSPDTWFIIETIDLRKKQLIKVILAIQ